MSFLKSALLVAVAALSVTFIYKNCFAKKQNVIISGTTNEEFKELENVFRSNFELGLEKEGASFVVFKNGKKVVDLWGGYADKEANRLWKEDTITITYSSSKGIGALCVAILADRGRLRYDDLVSKHWPEFAKNGKANVTIQMAMSHEAGLIWLDGFTMEHARNPESIAKLMEDQKPLWPPGTDSRYHAVTFGYIADQIIRHTDEKKRGIGQFLKEEVTGPNGIDYHLGLSNSEAYRVARIVPATIWDTIYEGLTDWNVFRIYWTMFMNPNTEFEKSVSPFGDLFHKYANNPDYYVLEQAGALGIGSARSMAEMYNMFVTEKLVSSKTLDQVNKHHVNKTDSMGMSIAKGHGFMHWPLGRAGTTHIIGHPGYGCQMANYDRKNKIVIGYTTNEMKVVGGSLCRTYENLQSAVYDIIEKKVIV